MLSPSQCKIVERLLAGETLHVLTAPGCDPPYLFPSGIDVRRNTVRILKRLGIVTNVGEREWRTNIVTARQELARSLPDAMGQARMEFEA